MCTFLLTFRDREWEGVRVMTDPVFFYPLSLSLFVMYSFSFFWTGLDWIRNTTSEHLPCVQNFLHAGDHVHLGPGVTATRQTNPAVDLHDLPRIDLICLSHYHAFVFRFPYYSPPQHSFLVSMPIIHHQSRHSHTYLF